MPIIPAQDFLVHTRKATWCAICSVFGIDPVSEEAAALIRYTDLDDTTTVELPRDKNVIYITVSQDRDTGSTAASSFEYTNDKAVKTRTIPVLALITCYGPNSAAIADRLWAGLSVDLGYDSPRSVYRRARLVPVIPFQRPVSVPEEQGGMWRKRSDLRVQLNLLWTDEYPFSPLEAPPDVFLAL